MQPGLGILPQNKIRKQNKNIIKQQIKKQNQIYKTNIDENKIEKSEIIGYFEIKKYIKWLTDKLK